MATTGAQGRRQKKGAAELRLARAEAALPGEDADITDYTPLGREALEVAASWALIGIFCLLGLAVVSYMKLVLIPITLAIVVGIILGMAAERLGEMGVPRFGTALILSSAVAVVLFLLINALAGPIGFFVENGPDIIEQMIDRVMPFLQRQEWLNISPVTFQTGPMSMEKLLENSSSVLAVLTASLTPAIIQAMIFFAALMLFLYGRVRLRRTVIMAFPRRHQRLIAIRVLNSMEEVLGYYFATAAMLYLALGVSMTVIAYLGNLGSPVMWGIFAFISSFIPYLGITLMTASVALGGVLTHDTLILGLLPAFVFFVVHLLMENLVFPAIMGRQWEINPFLVFIAIIFWTWMWGAVGAMLALPLSLIVMTIANELFPERKTVPHLPG
ncbi:putative PurR-regulated permease PerM [Pseudorhizobium tarimense]|uniref:PurR-regulated permease PerM n=1 Tax=Pseudorhizobium tarimense TaxID=1079109 RepID=A0ABV2H0G5_9HYPH|nr:AI-2E family transporter [Pseudorhizobium tarimense]MCJ8517378.1 AI-2E family transporter [Pseudorhizobium tarimense]